ncbi:MAG: hypothetical protein FJ211_07870 [Ignavibacteria bacterium]|nr:hypothetical protein [Ignavibacteria bacterium]
MMRCVALATTVFMAVFIAACSRSHVDEGVGNLPKPPEHSNQHLYEGLPFDSRVMSLLYPAAGGIEQLSSEAIAEVRANYPDTTYAVRCTSGKDVGFTQLYIINKLRSIPRNQDSLILASVVQDNLDIKAHASAGMIDLHVLLLRNGQLKLLDSQKDVVTHDRGIATCDADSIIRFGLNTWGWIVSTVTTGQGLFLQNQSFYAFVDGKIVSLGRYEAKEDDSGALERGFHSITSRFVLKDTLTESLSPLTIY